MRDIVTHSRSVMIAQADGGRYAATTTPATATDALTTISSVSRGALADMRNILGVCAMTTPTLARGYSNAKIGEPLFVAEATVKPTWAGS